MFLKNIFFGGGGLWLQICAKGPSSVHLMTVESRVGDLNHFVTCLFSIPCSDQSSFITRTPSDISHDYCTIEIVLILELN